MNNSSINTTDKQLIMGMTFEFAIIIIKLAVRLKNLNGLTEDELDDIRQNVCGLQHLIGITIDMDTDDLHKGASIAMANNGIDGLGDFAES